MANNIYDYVMQQEAAFIHPIDLDGWQWNFKDHVKTSFYYKHGRLLSGNDPDVPVKNITRPLLNLQYRAEDIDVKDITLYVDDPLYYHLSFLVKKYHDDVFLQENNLDDFIDEHKEAKIDYGVSIAKYVGGPKPDVVDLRSVAFCDQTDITKGPIAFKHFFNPAELKDMEERGWGKEENGANATINDLIALSEQNRNEEMFDQAENETPGNYIEVYEVHGVLPKMFIEDADPNTFSRQFHIIGFYRGKDNEKHGVTLFAKEQKKNPIKVALRDRIYSRAAGFGGAEELFEPQVWTNYDEIRKKDLLDGASKTILKAVGADIKSRFPNGLKDMENLQILDLNEGEDVGQIDTTPRQMALFNESISEWQRYAQQISSATDPILGERAPSGTPFRAQERQVIESKGLHNYRREKFAKHLEEIYRDWIIPHIANKVTQGTKFLSELSADEMKFVSERLAENQARKMMKEKILNGELVSPQEIEQEKQRAMDKFRRDGNKKFLEILKGEFSKKPIRVKINVKGTQEDLTGQVDSLVNVFRQVISAPQILQDPNMQKLFNKIIELSGLDPSDFAEMGAQPQQPQQMSQPRQTQQVSEQLQQLTTQ